MEKHSFWKKEFKFTPKSLLWALPMSFVLSGIFFWVFINYLFPYFASLPGFRGLTPRFPVVVEKTEQVFINQNVNVQGVYDRLRAITVTVLSAPKGSKPSVANLQNSVFGAGLIVTSDGYVFTAKSAIGSPDSAVWVLHETQGLFEASVVAFDPRSDVAIIKIAAENLPVAQFGNANSLAKGDSLVAAGAALGKSQAATAVVFAVRPPSAQNVPPASVSSDVLSEHLAVSPDLAGQKAFLGAPLAARDAAVVGMITGEGVIPGEYLDNSLKFFLANHSLMRKSLGLQYLPVFTGLSAYLKLPKENGALLVSVKPGSPAQAAGLREGDFIYRINGRDVNLADTLENILDSLISEDKLVMELFRENRQINATINLK